MLTLNPLHAHKCIFKSHDQRRLSLLSLLSLLLPLVGVQFAAQVATGQTNVPDRTMNQLTGQWLLELETSGELRLPVHL